MTSLDNRLDFKTSWIEWRRRCSLHRCSTATHRQMLAFAQAQFDLYCRRYGPAAASSGPHPLVPAPADCWHLFEFRLLVHETREGKRYKAWLSDRVRQTPGQPLSAWTFGATALMRDVVRGYLAHECPHPRSLCWDEAADPSVQLRAEEWVVAEATPASEVMDREFDRIAGEEAAQFWPDIDRRERIALAARDLGYSFSDPRVLQASSQKKTAIHKRYRQVMERIANRLRRAYAAEDPSAAHLLTRRVIRHLADRTVQ